MLSASDELVSAMLLGADASIFCTVSVFVAVLAVGGGGAAPDPLELGLWLLLRLRLRLRDCVLRLLLLWWIRIICCATLRAPLLGERARALRVSASGGALCGSGAGAESEGTRWWNSGEVSLVGRVPLEWSVGADAECGGVG